MRVSLALAGVVNILSTTPLQPSGDFVHFGKDDMFSGPASKMKANFRRPRPPDPVERDGNVTRHAFRRGVIPDHVLEAYKTLSGRSLRCFTSFGDLLQRLDQTKAAREVILGYCGSISARSRRFVLAGRKDSAYARVLNSFTQLQHDGHKVVVVLGDGFWSNKTKRGTKHASNVPSVTRFLARFLRVVRVDEHLTSKRCCLGCGGDMSYSLAARTGACSKSEGRGVCLNSNTDRDSNAASNMLRIIHAHLHDGSRPAHLQRDEPAGV